MFLWGALDNPHSYYEQLFEESKQNIKLCIYNNKDIG